MSKQSKICHPIFRKENGSGPWPCYLDGCDEPVVDLFVHHIDEDPTNNDPGNLTAIHRGCHNALHHAGAKRAPFTEEHRRKLSESNRRRTMSDETRRKISESLTGRKASAETRAKMSASHIARYRD